MIEIKNNQTLDKYIKEFQDDVTVSEYNIREKSLTASAMWAKWLSYLYHEKENLDRINDAKQKIIKKKMSENKLQDSVLRLKSEEKIVQNNENIKKLNVLAKQTQDNIDYIERCLQVLSQFGFTIKNVVEVMKLSFSH